jgi:K+-transporting ATPase KdpF subunit
MGVASAARELLKLRHDGLCLYCRDLRILCSRDRLRLGMRSIMSTWELILGGVMAVGLTVYLIYAMLRPEKF